MLIPTSGMYIVDKSLFPSVEYCYILLLYNQVSIITIHKLLCTYSCVLYSIPHRTTLVFSISSFTINLFLLENNTSPLHHARFMVYIL
jgi:hypothetical protein